MQRQAERARAQILNYVSTLENMRFAYAHRGFSSSGDSPENIEFFMNPAKLRAENTYEIFYTLQGEGANVGRPAVFCRFSECNLWSGREEIELRLCVIFVIQILSELMDLAEEPFNQLCSWQELFLARGLVRFEVSLSPLLCAQEGNPFFSSITSLLKNCTHIISISR